MASLIDAHHIINSAARALNDELKVTWTNDELLIWLELSQLEIVNLVPHANVKNVAVKLASGVKQRLPADGIRLLDIPYNYKGSGTLMSSTINGVPKSIMNKRVPGWTTHTANATVKHFIYTVEDPLVFYVYPPQPSLPAYVELVYSAIPDVIPNTNEGTKITIGDQYENVLLNLVVSKALYKDSEYGNNAAKAREYRMMALQELGAGTQAQTQPQYPTQAPVQAQSAPSR